MGAEGAVEAEAAGPTSLRVLLPLLNPALASALLELAGALAGSGGEVLLLSVAEVADEASLVRGMPLARAYRAMMGDLERGGSAIRARSIVRVFDDVALGIAETVRETASDLLLLPWKGFARRPDRVFGELVDRLLAEPPCDVAITRLPVPAPPWNVLVAARGGSYADLAIDLAARLTVGGRRLTVVHAAGSGAESPFELKGVGTVGRDQPAPRLVRTRGDARTAILEEARNHNLVLLGATGQAGAVSPLGPLGERLARDLRKGLLVVKTRGPLLVPQTAPPPHAARGRVDRWFAENTYHCREFADIGRLVELKRARGLTVSVAEQTLDDEATITGLLKATLGLLQQEFPLLDEVAVIDRGSSDRTCRIATDLGVRVHNLRRVLPRQGGGTGLGDALWKSLHVLTGDLIVWLDPAVRDPHPRFVYGVLGPLLTNPELAYVTGFSCPPPQRDETYDPPASTPTPTPTPGATVTDLVVRPLFNLVVPELSGLIQPLAEQRAGRRDVLERVPFWSGAGVDAGLAVDIHALTGLRGLAQVDLSERPRRERDPEEQARTATAVLRVLLRRLGDRHQVALTDQDAESVTMRIPRCEHGEYALDSDEVVEQERPSIGGLAAYRRAHRVGGR